MIPENIEAPGKNLLMKSKKNGATCSKAEIPASKTVPPKAKNPALPAQLTENGLLLTETMYS